MPLEQFLLGIEDSVVRVALHDDRGEHGTSVALVSKGNEAITVLPTTAEEPDETEVPRQTPDPPPSPDYPAYPWFPMSLAASHAAEGRRVALAELHVDTSGLPAGRVTFVLELFAEGVRAALAASVEQPFSLTRDEAERWGARLFALAE